MKRLLLAVVLLLAATTLHAAAPGVIAITGGTVHTASGSPIPNGTVVIREGLIEAAGASVTIPPDATVIEVKGAHVYPGLIDAQTSLGFPSGRPPRRGRGAAAQPSREEPLPDLSAASLAARGVKLSDDDIAARRATGVTTILTAPTYGIFNGQSVLIHLDGEDIASRVVRSPVTMQIAFNPRSSWTYPDSLMGTIAYIRQTLYDAQQASVAAAIYEKSPAGLRRPEINEALAALAPVLRRELPVVFTADSDLQIRRAQAIAREFNLRYIIAGARQAYLMADELRNVPVLVSVRWPQPPTVKEDREEQPLRLIRDRALAPSSPAALAKAGATFALVSGAAKTSEFLPGIRRAIEHGLSDEEALRAVTLAPARILGVDRQLGSLEKGKIANVVVTDKPLFDKEAKVTRMFIDGREVKVDSEKKDRGETASPVDGTWNLMVRAPQGEISIRVTLHLEDGKLTGSFSGDRGSGDIRSGSFDNGTIEFTITVSGQQSTEGGDWLFHGTIRDSSMEGTVNTTLGTLQFTGSRSR